MSYRGTVKGGVIVLESGTELPEGTPVRIDPETPADPASEKAADPADFDNDPLMRMLKFAGPTGIQDLSINADHYLYGHPKVNDGE
jgi:hypothetical protein